MNSLACNNAGDGDDCDDGDNHDDDEGDGDDCGDDSDDFHLGITRTGEQARHCYVSTFFHGQHLQSWYHWWRWWYIVDTNGDRWSGPFKW